MQQPFEKQPNKQIFEKWMSGAGPAHLFIYYQKPYKMNEQGEIEPLRQPEEFIVTDGKSKFDFGHTLAAILDSEI